MAKEEKKPQPTDIETANTKIEELQQENETSKQGEENKNFEIANLTEDNKILKQVNEELTKKLEAIGDVKTVAQAAEKISENKPAIIPTESFEVDGVKYKFISPSFSFEKKKFKSANAILDADLLARLVARGVGFIVQA